MEKLVKFCKTLGPAEEGLETVEYAVISGIIVAATILTLDLIGADLSRRFGDLLTAVGG